MAEKSIGLIELFSIAAGFLVADTMLKAGNVRLILSRSICSGKYMVLIGVEAGAEAANGCLIDQFVIANVHPDVIAEAGVLVSAIVISRPHPDVYREVI